jgi:hypothetical protein
MNRLGKKTWKLISRLAGEEGIVHPLEFIADEIVSVGPKTFRRRLNDGQWQVRELQELQQWFKKSDPSAAVEFAMALNEEYQLFPESILKHAEG